MPTRALAQICLHTELDQHCSGQHVTVQANTGHTGASGHCGTPSSQGRLVWPRRRQAGAAGQLPQSAGPPGGCRGLPSRTCRLPLSDRGHVLCVCMPAWVGACVCQGVAWTSWEELWALRPPARKGGPLGTLSPGSQQPMPQQAAPYSPPPPPPTSPLATLLTGSSSSPPVTPHLPVCPVFPRCCHPGKSLHFSLHL